MKKSRDSLVGSQEDPETQQKEMHFKKISLQSKSFFSSFHIDHIKWHIALYSKRFLMLVELNMIIKIIFFFSSLFFFQSYVASCMVHIPQNRDVLVRNFREMKMSSHQDISEEILNIEVAQEIAAEECKIIDCARVNTDQLVQAQPPYLIREINDDFVATPSKP